MAADAVSVLDAEGIAPDEALRGGPTYAQELAEVTGFAGFAGVSLPISVIDPPTVARLHAAGLDVWTWTLRTENRYLPPEHRLGAQPAAAGDWRTAWTPVFAAGVDAVFTDQPDVAVALRLARAAASGRCG